MSTTRSSTTTSSSNQTSTSSTSTSERAPTRRVARSPTPPPPPPPQPAVAVRSRRSSRLSPILSLLLLLPLFIYLPWQTTKHHFALPTPKTELYNVRTGLPQLSEKAILEHSRVLSEDIGFRTVGTREHALGDQYVHEQALRIQKECEDVVKKAPTRKLECEVWRQEGSGTHRFDMMGKPVFKVYENLSNIIIRISNGTPAGKAHALLLNAHVDSTVPSPGAADDALSVGILFEIARNLVHTPGWEPAHSIVFLFNNAEESLQDGSHLFATQHPLANLVRAVINLEAAGNTGPEILFQATSEEMIQAYAQVPYPYATVLANDVFKSGIILSDTDFRQFEEYRNLTGLDMAVVGDSYLYHTRKDLVKNIQPGVAQHFAENVMAIVKHLTSPLGATQVLPSLARQVTPPTSIYFSVVGKYFFLYSVQTAWKVLLVVLLASMSLFAGTTSPDLRRTIWKATGGVLGSLVGAALGAGVTASIMAKILEAGMSWFSKETSCFVLYGPPALAGALAAQYFLVARSPPTEIAQFEYATLFAIHIVNVFAAIILQVFQLGSSSIFTLFSFGSLFALILNTFLNALGNRSRRREPDWTVIHLATYAVAQVVPLVVGSEMAVGLLGIFVPLTGRMGEVAPVEHIIAIMTALLGFLISATTVLPFSHRVRRSALLLAVLVVSLFSAITMLIYAYGSHPFDAMHQKRIFVLHFEDITQKEHHLHLAAADGAPGFSELVQGVATKFSKIYQQPVPVMMDDNNADWDIIYPFSQFLTPYKIPLPKPYNYASPFTDTFTVTAVHDVFNYRSNTRSVTLLIDHPGIIWTAIAFDAHVLEWSLSSPPLEGYQRYHFKEASFYGTTQWKLDLVLSVPPRHPERSKLRVDFMGIIEKGSWPGKKLDKHPAGPGIQLLEKLDEHLFKSTDDSVDAMLLSCVGGQVIV
ncbi:hypothetical protein M407DRAFT_73396 [Tulasnella calospora MUT 4182]|uniref:Peptide hydrolase n=1 Tax=Tulasnella calospora MUT 4182 TaxID=1051891 RepID=A0A0C3QAH9_9AGAM|nr:hypothetical protein M407DRAFT_73396 [Tulasnella calospora MUT 4182]